MFQIDNLLNFYLAHLLGFYAVSIYLNILMLARQKIVCLSRASLFK
jgi:hypothetical protein